MSGPSLRGTVRIPAGVGVTQRCLPGGISRRGQAVTRRWYRAGWGRCQGIRPSWRADCGGLGAVGGAEAGDALVGLARGKQPRPLLLVPLVQDLGQATCARPVWAAWLLSLAVSSTCR